MTMPANPSSGPVLAIAVFGETASVALRRGDASAELVHVDESITQSHSARMLPLVSEVMARAGCRPADLAGIAFEAGPGGFTSLRVACALAQGMGIALGVPVCPVGTLEAAAVSVGLAHWRAGVDEPHEYCVLVANDARMGECYFGVFDVVLRRGLASASVTSLLEVDCAGPQAVIDALGDWSRQRSGLRVAGGAHRRHVDFAGALARVGITAFDTRADGAAIAMIAGGPTMAWLDPADAVPRYVREKVALDVDEQRALRAARA